MLAIIRRFHGSTILLHKLHILLLNVIMDFGVIYLHNTTPLTHPWGAYLYKDAVFPV